MIQIWKDKEIFGYEKSWQEYLDSVTKQGYQAILSSPWYINFVSYGYNEWYEYYKINPTANLTSKIELNFSFIFLNFKLNYILDNDQIKLVIGGETCLWAEYVDGTNIGN